MDEKWKYLSEDVFFKILRISRSGTPHDTDALLKRDVLRNSVAQIACQRGVEHFM